MTPLTAVATDRGHSFDKQVYYGAHGHADGMWMAAEDLHYYDDARERVMVYPGGRSAST